MLTKDEGTLLENVIEALNRLFDLDSSAADIHALFFATSRAFRGTRLCPPFEAPIHKIEAMLRSQELPDKKCDLALEITDELRKFVAEELRADAKANPRQRHSL